MVEELNNDILVAKSKLLYILHILVPMTITVLSTLTLAFSFLISSNEYSTVDIGLYDNMTDAMNFNKKEVVIELLNLNNKEDQQTILKVLCVFNFVLGGLQFLYSKLMNNKNHELGNKVIEVSAQKETILEQLTTITSSLSVAASTQHETVLANFPELTQYMAPTPLMTPNDRVDVQDNNDPPATSRTNSTVYIRPYVHVRSNTIEPMPLSVKSNDSEYAVPYSHKPSEPYA